MKDAVTTAASLAVVAAVLFYLPFAAAQSPRDEGLAAWKRIETVLVHPRCINCHTVTDFPRQGDDRHRHLFRVVRGPQNKGPAAAACSTCHQAMNQANGVPGAPGWHLAPLSMAWESSPGVPMESAQLCRTIIDKRKNHGMDATKLEHHFGEDAFIRWAWAPGHDLSGKARATPPLTHAETMGAFRAWARAGMPCPS
jgi:hypothetical protein